MNVFVTVEAAPGNHCEFEKISQQNC